jgi:hypothetical protein
VIFCFFFFSFFLGGQAGAPASLLFLLFLTLIPSFHLIGSAWGQKRESPRARHARLEFETCRPHSNAFPFLLFFFPGARRPLL